MDEQLRALGRALDDLVKRHKATKLEIHYDPRYTDEPWEVSLTVGPSTLLTGEGRTAEEAARHAAEAV